MHFFLRRRDDLLCSQLPKRLEARVGIEPTHKGFADLSLTAWVPRHLLNHCTARVGAETGLATATFSPSGSIRYHRLIFSMSPPSPGIREKNAANKAATWSGRRDLNPRPSPWQGDALPLSYSRIRPEAVYRSAHRRVNARPIPGPRDTTRRRPAPYRCPASYRPPGSPAGWAQSAA